MARQTAVVVLEFDDDGGYEDCSDLAVDVEVILGRAGFKGLDVTVYSTPEDAAADAADGQGAYARDRADPPRTLPVAVDRSPRA